MRRLISSALACVLLTSLCSPSFSADPGRTQGRYGVSPSGAATYSIPIWTPPGPNGLTPSISLDYNSQSGNSLAGVGWNLSAALAIERCNRTKAQDGGAAPIDLSTNDKFCINGKRLRAISGTYGFAGSVYYTEIADYSRITAYNTMGNGPEHFIVEAKSGLRYEYGKTASSRVVLGNTVLRWMLNKVSDRNGNNYVISYSNGNGFAIPDVISWTPLSLNDTSYLYEAKFNYIPGRTDKDSYKARVAGFDIANNNRLDSIQIKSGGVVKRRYRFTYDLSPVTSRSRLTSFQECSHDTDTSKCLLPTTFTYQTGVSGVVAGAAPPPTGSSNGIVKGRYDLNGDGKDDIIYINGGVCTAAFGAPYGFSTPVSVGTSSCGFVDRFLPNGRDAIGVNVSGSLWIYRWNDATGAFVGYNTGISATTMLAVDYDGDNLADLVTKSADNKALYIRRNTSTGSGNPSFEATPWVALNLTGLVGPQGGALMFADVWSYFGKGLKYTDVNGDGRQDIHAVVIEQLPMGATGWSMVILGQTGGFYLPPYSTWQASNNVDFPSINFNSDACTDRLGGSTIYISQCNGVAATTSTAPATPLQVLDWDGDGRTDILVDSGGNFAVYLSTGTAFSGPVSTTIPSAGTLFAVDQDGDHLEDLIRANGSSAISYWTHTSAGYVPTTPGSFATNIPDLLSGATDGFGVNFSPKYFSTAWGGYDKGDVTSFPLQEAKAQIVVGQVTASDGLNGTFNTTYYYRGARINAERGYTANEVDDGDWAGFQRIDATDMRNGLITQTSYEQQFPKTGMVSKRELLQPIGPPPNNTTSIRRQDFTNTYATLDPMATNQRYFVYASGATYYEYEVGGPSNGALLKTVATTNVYDNASGALYDQTMTTTEGTSLANGIAAGGSWTSRAYTPLANLLNDTNSWCLGRPQQVQQINSATVPASNPSITRTTSITWDATKCRPTQLKSEPANPTLEVTTDIEYDVFGNVSRSTVTGVNMIPRVTSIAYTDETHSTGQSHCLSRCRQRPRSTTRSTRDGITPWAFQPMPRIPMASTPCGTQTGTGGARRKIVLTVRTPHGGSHTARRAGLAIQKQGS